MKQHPRRYAAIDIGSNALRLVIGRFDARGELTVEFSQREPVRLGQDTFRSGKLSRTSIERATAAIYRFRDIATAFHVASVRVVATSAVRDATNRDEFIANVARVTKLSIELIAGEEEARLVHLAVSRAVALDRLKALLVDVGGGSVEVTVSVRGKILSAESLRMGTVRLLEMMRQSQVSPKKVQQLVSEYASHVRQHLSRPLQDIGLKECIGTGGNLEALADLRTTLLKKAPRGKLTIRELEGIVRRLQGMSVEQRIEKLRLRPDRADVIVPAGLVVHALMVEAGVSELRVPKVGLKEGVLIDLHLNSLRSSGHLSNRNQREQLIGVATEVARKYAVNLQHAKRVVGYSTSIFDRLKYRHRYNGRPRMLLETAALLHEIGHFVDVTDHHKHASYIIRATPILGLSPQDRQIVAAVVRYHRRSEPTPRHDIFHDLSASDRLLVRTLAGILRLANSFDKEHLGNVRTVSIRRQGCGVVFSVRGKGELLVERWAFENAKRMLESVLNLPLIWKEK
jgi:exopolyphosphatase/guanosine-5'-triphosphate,3'-diphosphate pyrophosphatase